MDIAAKFVDKSFPGLTPQQYGTAVHFNVQQQIKALGNPSFRAEISLIKEFEESYGSKNPIRIDVLEKVSSEIVCVYDIKTGVSGLSTARRAEIANAAYAFEGKFPARTIVTEIRPAK